MILSSELSLLLLIMFSTMALLSGISHAQCFWVIVFFISLSVFICLEHIDGLEVLFACLPVMVVNTALFKYLISLFYLPLSQKRN